MVVEYSVRSVQAIKHLGCEADVAVIASLSGTPWASRVL